MENLLYLNMGTPEIILFFAVPFILLVYCLFDITRSKFNDPINKLLWTIIVVFVPILGSILYLVLGRSQKKEAFGSIQN